MRRLKRIIIGTLSIVFIGWLAPSAFACSCISDRTVVDAFESNPFVAILKLEAVGGNYKADPGTRTPGRGQSRLMVRQVFKGALAVGERLVFRQLASPACGWSFRKEDIGKEFLFYFRSGQEPDEKIVKPAVWSGSICSGSGLLSSKRGDIAYLSDYEKVKGKTRVSGMVRKESGASSYTGLARHTLTIEGNGKEAEVATDRNGLYQVYDLAPGKYTITVDDVEGYKIRDSEWSVEFELEAGGHFEHDFAFDRGTAGSMHFIRVDSFVNPLLGCTLAER